MSRISSLAPRVCKYAERNIGHMDGSSLRETSKWISGLISTAVGITTNLAWILFISAAPKAKGIKTPLSKSGQNLYNLYTQQVDSTNKQRPI